MHQFEVTEYRWVFPLLLSLREMLGITKQMETFAIWWFVTLVIPTLPNDSFPLYFSSWLPILQSLTKKYYSLTVFSRLMIYLVIVLCSFRYVFWSCKRNKDYPFCKFVRYCQCRYEWEAQELYVEIRMIFTSRHILFLHSV